MRERAARIFSAGYEYSVLGLLIAQYAFVNLIFTTYTQNIVIIKDLAAPFFSILVLGIWIAGDLLTRGEWRLPRSGVVPPMVVALLAWTAFALIGPSTASAIELVGRMAGYFVLAWALIRFVDSRRRLEAVVAAVVVTNLIMVAYGFGQLQGWDALVALEVIPDWGMNVFVSTHGSPNFLAAALVTTLPILVGWTIVTTSRVTRAGLAVLVVLNLYCVISSDYWPSWLALEITLSLFTLALLPSIIRGRAHWKRWVRPTILAFVVTLLIVGAEESRTSSWSRKVLKDIVAMNLNFGSSLVLVGDDCTTAYSQRFSYFWQIALDGALREPWLGRGLGAFNWRMPETRPPHYHRSGISHNTDHPYNEHFEWLHDTGIVGLTLFWWILAAYAVVGYRLIRGHRGGTYWPLAFAAFLGPWNLWILASFSVSSRWTGNNVTLWYVIGLFLALGNLGRKDPPLAAEAVPPAIQPEPESAPVFEEPPWIFFDSVALRRCAGVVLITMALASGYLFFAWRFWQADHHLRNNMMHTEGGGGDIRPAIWEAERTRDLTYMNPSLFYKLAYSYLVAGRLNDALTTYRVLQSFAPNYAQIHINLAFLNDQLGYRAASAFERDRAAIIEHNTRNHRDAAQHWAELGAPQRAIAHLRQCLTITADRVPPVIAILWHDYDSIYADLARLHLSLGDTPQAFLALEKSLHFNPANQAAGLMLTELQARPDDREAVDRLLKLVANRAPDNPALLVASMEMAIDEGRHDEALAFAATAVDRLALPPFGGQPDPEMLDLCNSLLKGLQKIFAANHDPARCFALAGWVYACQGRYQEADDFLSKAYAVSYDPLVAERLGLVKARLHL